jgi:hypothetical protein
MAWFEELNVFSGGLGRLEVLYKSFIRIEYIQHFVIKFVLTVFCFRIEDGKKLKEKKFHVRSARCSLWGAGDISCILKALYRALNI